MKKIDIKNLIILILSIIGLITCFDLVYIYIKTNFIANANTSFCTINDFVDCDGVARTHFAFFLGVPLAIWGVILYLIFIFLVFADKIKTKFPSSIFRVFVSPMAYIATIGLFSFCVSICLGFLSIFSIGKICVLCFFTYCLNLLIAIVAGFKTSIIQNIKTTILDAYQGIKEYLLLFIIFLILCTGLFTYLTISNVMAPVIKKEQAANQFKEFRENKFRKSGNTLGNQRADVRIYIYSDLRCPFCKITNSMMNKLVSDYKYVEVIHMNYPLDTSCNKYIPKTMHKGACELSKLAIASRKQGNYWGMVNEIFDIQNDFDMKKISQKLNLDYNQLHNDFNSKETEKILASEIELAQTNNINATPTIVINDVVYVGSMPYDELLKKVKLAHKRIKNK